MKVTEEATSIPPKSEQASVFGMWVFLVTEAMFFGGVIGAFMTYYYLYPRAFFEASRHMNVTLGAVNTLVLLTSSFLMALAVYYAKEKDRRNVLFYLTATVLLAALFIVIKATEYAEHAQHQLLPIKGFPFAEGPQSKLFFGFYFVMTGLHALHVLAGIGLLSYMAFAAARRNLSGPYPARIHMAGLYWHFVDIVWIFLFPLLYLVGR